MINLTNQLAKPVIETRSRDSSITRPSKLYAANISLKRKLRGYRGALFKSAGYFRDSVVFRGWNEAHREQLAKSLGQIVKSRQYLSEDSLRERKIEQLESVLYDLKSDYRSGRIANL